jgi:hypothetical protein
MDTTHHFVNCTYLLFLVLSTFYLFSAAYQIVSVLGPVLFIKCWEITFTTPSRQADERWKELDDIWTNNQCRVIKPLLSIAIHFPLLFMPRIAADFTAVKSSNPIDRILNIEIFLGLSCWAFYSETHVAMVINWIYVVCWIILMCDFFNDLGLWNLRRFKRSGELKRMMGITGSTWYQIKWQICRLWCDIMDYTWRISTNLWRIFTNLWILKLLTIVIIYFIILLLYFLNIIHVGCKVATFICTNAKDNMHLLKWKTWSKSCCKLKCKTIHYVYMGCLMVKDAYNIAKHNFLKFLQWKICLLLWYELQHVVVVIKEGKLKIYSWLWCNQQQMGQVVIDDADRLEKQKDTLQIKDYFSTCSSGTNMSLLRHFLHNQDFNPNQINLASGDSGLHIACHHGQARVVQAMLDVKKKTINLNIENGNGFTPLMVVAANGSKIILHRLLKETKLKLKNQHGERAISVAVEAEHFAIALSICEEMTKRGLLLEHPSIFLYLSRCVALSSGIKKTGLNEGQDKTSLAVYQATIMKALSVKNKEEDKFSKERVLEELIDFLDCGICFEEFGDSTIFSCANDHWLCTKCLPRNSCCPWCREKFSLHPPQRRRTSEKILKLLAMIKD